MARTPRGIPNSHFDPQIDAVFQQRGELWIMRSSRPDSVFMPWKLLITRFWNALLQLRRSFLEKLLNTAPDLRQHMLEQNSLKFLKAMIYQRNTIILVAKFAYDVLELFYSVPIYRPGSAVGHEVSHGVCELVLERFPSLPIDVASWWRRMNSKLQAQESGKFTQTSTSVDGTVSYFWQTTAQFKLDLIIAEIKVNTRNDGKSCNSCVKCIKRLRAAGAPSQGLLISGDEDRRGEGFACKALETHAAAEGTRVLELPMHDEGMQMRAVSGKSVSQISGPSGLRVVQHLQWLVVCPTTDENSKEVSSIQGHSARAEFEYYEAQGKESVPPSSLRQTG
ncbi:hypothetical protein C8R45DRAFT_943537 [Mycena sanguinolenta]|nr:hypothetical protein C8R45DRAFT_943537 [Mycena sanguinolenta]